MDASGVARQILSGLERKGCRGRIVSVNRITDLKKEIDLSHSQGVLDDLFYRERLTWFQFSFSEAFPNARSIIIASAPQPQQRVTFQFEGRTFDFIVPPTYSDHTDRLLEKAIMDVLRPVTCQIQRARLPEKLLAVRSGLARYGKNNIAYIEGLGSFHRLRVFLSDLPADEDTWSESEMMEQCGRCSACIKKCPTGAILSDRFLIRAERCLTFHNERKADFPDWIDPAWHNCLVGCMVCQLVCPANKAVRGQFGKGESFTEKETALVLKGVSADQVPRLTANKLQRLGLLEDVALLARNLNVLIRQRSS
jgi:epoxyqueuosine reductase